MDVADKLQQLAEMHRRGELTDAEFAMAKQATLEVLTAVAPSSSSVLSPFQNWPNNAKKAPLKSGFWKRHRLTIALFCIIIFIIVALLALDIFNSTNSLMKAFPQELGSSGQSDSK